MTFLKTGGIDYPLIQSLNIINFFFLKKIQREREIIFKKFVKIDEPIRELHLIFCAKFQNIDIPLKFETYKSIRQRYTTLNIIQFVLL